MTERRLGKLIAGHDPAGVEREDGEEGAFGLPEADE